MIACFCDPHPDEVLYSVWARYSDRVRYPYKTEVLRELFGSITALPNLEFPCYLKYFVDNLPSEHEYTVDYFIDHHTLLPYYGAFFPPERLKSIKEQMIIGDATRINLRTGSASGRKGIPSPSWLRYCPKCVEEDRAQFGECYWHRLHQIPGVELCPLHKTFLEQSRLLARGRENGYGFKSAEQTIKPNLPRSAASSPFFKVFMDITMESSYLLEYPFSLPDPHLFYQRYRILLAQHSYMTPKGKIRMDDFLKAFIEYYPAELLHTLHCEIKQFDHWEETWVARLTHNKSPIFHPLYHILVIHFLDSTLERFYLQDHVLPSPFGNGPWPCLNPVCEYYQQRIINTYQTQEVYIKGKVTGKFTCTCGYTYVRSGPDPEPNDIFRKVKVSSYGLKWEAKLSELWSDSKVSIKSIARVLGIDPETVRLQAARLNLPARQSTSVAPFSAALSREIPPTDKKKDRTWYRTQWLSILDETPDEALYILQRRAKGIYSWLHRHDRDWLAVHHPAPGRRSRLQITRDSARVDQRNKDNIYHDALIAESIRIAAHKLMNLPGRPTRVTTSSIIIDVPEVRQVQASKNDLPLAAQALREVAETREAFLLRRIKWVLDRYLEEQIYPRGWQFLERAGLKMQILEIRVVQQAFDEAMTILSQFA